MSGFHELKTWSEPFQAVWDELKPYELRKNDRDYQAGDLLFLREWVNGSDVYTGRAVLARVTYLTRGGDWGLPPELCVLGLRVLACIDEPQERP